MVPRVVLARSGGVSVRANACGERRTRRCQAAWAVTAYQVSRTVEQGAPRIYAIVRLPREACAQTVKEKNSISFLSALPPGCSRLLAHAQADAAKAAKGGENTGPRLRKVVLFVIGGITRSELRAVYEISKATGEGRHVRHVTPLKRVCVSGTDRGCLRARLWQGKTSSSGPHRSTRRKRCVVLSL